MAPRLALRVDNKLTDDGSKMNVEMNFNNMIDFEPDQVVQQVEPLRKLVEARRSSATSCRRPTGTTSWKRC